MDRVCLRQLQVTPDGNFLTSSCPPPFTAITESWLKGYISGAQVQIKRYQCFRSDRPERVGGGCLLFVHDHIMEPEYYHCEDKYHNLMCYAKSCNTKFVFVYRPPGPELLGWKRLLNFLQMKIDSLSENAVTPNIYIV